MAFAALFLLPFGLPALPALAAAPQLLAAVLVVAILSTAIPVSLEFEALKRMPPRTYGVLITLEPAVAVMIGILLLGERLDLAGGFAVACVTLAAIGVSLFERR